MFRTAYEAIQSHSRVYSAPGSRTKTLYTPSFDQFGHMELKVSGQENLYDFIQSHKESCDIHVILARFAAGDQTALARRQVFYADLTEFPETYADVVNTMHGAEDYFNHLPVEVRAKFGHDFNKFLASLDNPQTLVELGVISAPDLAGSNIPSETIATGATTAQVPPEAVVPSASETEVK